MNKRMPTVKTINLGYEQMLVIDAGDDSRLRVLHGATWLTGEGELDDVVLGAGQERALRQGRSVAQALGPASVELREPATPGALRALRQAWRHVARGLRRLATRWQLGASDTTAPQSCGV